MKLLLRGRVEKIVNLWPAGTSSFFVMGAGDLIAGLAINNPGTMNRWTQFFYPQANDIPAMGGTTPAIEELMNLEPDLVIVHPMTVSDPSYSQISPLKNLKYSQKVV